MVSTAPGAKIDLNQLLASSQLPALPQSAIRILELSKDPDNGPVEFAPSIEADPGLASQVLRFVNSSYFGFSREISSVKLALTLVGVRTIKNFTLWSAVFSLMPNPRCGIFDIRSLWQDSLRRALFAREAGKLLGLKESDEAFAAALLQDMAVPLLAKEFSDTYAELLVGRQHGESRLSDLEGARFDWNHAHAAAQIARHWNLPEELAGPIESHASLDTLLESDRLQPAHLAVALSALLPAVIDNAWPEQAQFESYAGRVFANREYDLCDLLGVVDAGFVDFAPVLQIASPTRTLRQLLESPAGSDA
jgi:HD-like signal output (HDOD) protein